MSFSLPGGVKRSFDAASADWIGPDGQRAESNRFEHSISARSQSIAHGDLGGKPRRSTEEAIHSFTRGGSISYPSGPTEKPHIEADASVILIGLRGAGKSTLAVIASTALRRKIVEADIVFQEIHVSILYMLVNIAYFASVSKEEIINSGQLVAASMFKNVFGGTAERALSVFVALSAYGNVLSVIFSQGRLVQELGREGILPFSRFWASNRPFNAPLAGLFEHWLVSVIIMLAPPPGDAYNFILNLISYPLSIVNAFVSGGLLYLYANRAAWNWSPPISATWPVVLFFFLSNIYLIIAPFVPPTGGQNVYDHLPYWIHCVVGFGLIFAGGVYWVVWAKILPKLGKYELVREVRLDDIDGWERNVFIKRPLQEIPTSN